MAIDRDLAAPLDPRRVQSREGSGGKKLSYLTTHDVKRTANRIFGYDGWSYVVDDLISLGEEPFKNRNGKEGIRVGYRATVTVTIDGVQRGDVGYGDAMEYNGSRITPHELASKEAVSDALKRCLSSWGDQFGLVLYGADPAPPADDPYMPDEETKRAAAAHDEVSRREGPAAKLITQAQRKKMWATAKGYGLTEDELRGIVKRIADVESTQEIPRYLVDAILQEIEVQALGVGVVIRAIQTHTGEISVEHGASQSYSLGERRVLIETKSGDVAAAIQVSLDEARELAKWIMEAAS